MTETSSNVVVAAPRARAELLADIAASAIPHPGRLRGPSEFRERTALSRPSILRRAAAGLAVEVPGEADRLVAVDWQAAVLTTALSLHTGVPLSVISEQPVAASAGLEGVSAGENVVLVVASTADDGDIGNWVATLEDADVRVLTVLSLLAIAPPRDAAPGTAVPRVPRVALLTEEELAVSTVGVQR